MNVYTSLDQVLTDFMLFMAVKRGEPLTLGGFPQIARIRWPWIVANWDKTLHPTLERQVQGDDFLKDILASMSKDVVVYQLGATSYNPFSEPTKTQRYKSLLDLIAITTIRPTNDEQAYIREEVARVEDLRIADFENMVKYLRTDCALAAQRIGLGDEDGQEAMGVGTVTAQRSWTMLDLKQINAVFDIAEQIDGVIFGLRETADRTPDLISAAAQNVDPASGVQFRTDYQSAIAVPFERNLEWMAQKYLGDANRWFELCAINYLQSPYVDLYGTQTFLLSGGAGTSVRVSDTLKTSVPVGTRIKIGSSRYQEEVRYIERLTDNADGTITLDLSGEGDLSKFTLAERSFIRWYAPHTVNDCSLVLIPVAIGANFKRTPVPDADVLKRLDQSLLAFGVDVQRDEASGDFMVGASGDFQIVYGIPAVRQAVLYALKTQQGELPWHLRFGIPSTIGDRWSGTTDEALVFANTIQASLELDGRYEKVLLKDVRVTGNSISLDFIVKLQGNDTLIPLSFVA
jgi:hypothetical protein